MNAISLNDLNMVKPSFLARLLGNDWVMEADADQLFVTSHHYGRVHIPLANEKTSITSTSAGYRLNIQSDAGQIAFDSIPKHAAALLSSAIAQAKEARLRVEMREIDQRLDRAWETFCQVHGISQSEFIQKQVFAAHLPEFLEHIQEDLNRSQEISAMLSREKAFLRGANRALWLSRDPEGFRRNLNDKRLAVKYDECSSLFEKAGLRLTPEQAASALSMEKANLLEAGAGSGKTVVIVARALYAVHEGIANPEEIICLAYNKDAAEEISERIESAFSAAGLPGGNLIKVSTFHSFGAKLAQAATGNSLEIADEGDLVVADLFRKAIQSQLSESAGKEFYQRFCEDLEENHWKLKSTRGTNIETADMLAMELLMKAEAAFYLSYSSRSAEGLDEELVQNASVWGLTLTRAKNLNGYTRFIGDLSRSFRQLMAKEGKLDFAAMTIEAKKAIDKVCEDEMTGLTQCPDLQRKFIMVDEFQDISVDRAELVRAIASLHTDSVIFGVGDDWQSINRFSGSDLTLFTEFEEFFGDTDRRQLTATFRSCRGIAETARRFVINNPVQSRKKVNQVLDERIRDSIVVLEYTGQAGAERGIKDAIDHWLTTDDTEIPKIMILDRYGLAKSKVMNKDLLNTLRSRYQNKARIDFNTVHGSKGLEADYVIVTGLIDGVFPSARPKDFWEDLFRPREETCIKHADERRLFYVALTRARKAVALLTPKGRPSPFVGEVVRIFKKVLSEH